MIYKSHYNRNLLLSVRYKEKVQDLDWEMVNRNFLEGHNDVLSLIDLLLTIPASSSENERGFSLMKVTKTDRRGRMTTATLSESLAVQMLTPKVNY